MVSNIIDKLHGYLALSDEEYEEAKKLNSNIRKYAREFLEYGESREEFWNRDKFIRQMERAVSIACKMATCLGIRS